MRQYKSPGVTRTRYKAVTTYPQQGGNHPIDKAVAPNKKAVIRFSHIIALFDYTPPYSGNITVLRK